MPNHSWPEEHNAPSPLKNGLTVGRDALGFIKNPKEKKQSIGSFAKAAYGLRDSAVIEAFL